jgi:16S rRNA (guanine527-N7)-methyltransferase
MPRRGLPDVREVLAADRKRALSVTPVSRETTDRLDCFVTLLLDWQRKINLIAASTVASLWTRHVADSLQLVGLVPSARIWVDLGSGGGFPGLVIACALADAPETDIHLIESNAKKAAFLREASRALRLPAVVHHGRIEDFVARFAAPADVVTARAVAPLVSLLDLAEPLLKRGAQALFPKGQDVEAELTDASKYWNIEVELRPSLTEPRARIVVVRRAERRSVSNRKLQS